MNNFRLAFSPVFYDMVCHRATFEILISLNMLCIQPYHAQGSQSMKRNNHKYAPYPYSGSKGHHQGSAGKKYSGKYQSSSEGSSSTGSHSGEHIRLLFRGNLHAGWSVTL